VPGKLWLKEGTVLFHVVKTKNGLDMESFKVPRGGVMMDRSGGIVKHSNIAVTLVNKTNDAAESASALEEQKSKNASISRLIMDEAQSTGTAKPEFELGIGTWPSERV
jgi:hypothetical protein